MPVASSLVPIALPFGRRSSLRCGDADLSVTATVRATDGQWEPHVRALLERTIAPDWVCLDVGANIGIHTLNLGVLAPDGQVFAFEADPRNLEWLIENVRGLSQPHAQIEVVAHALWDRNETIHIASFEELTGCSFVSQSADATDSERRLRQILNPVESLRRLPLHGTIGDVSAIRLDEWAATKRLSRLDFIKMDIEGAEAKMLRGAVETIKRFRPILLTEYNPACAQAYFGERPDAFFEALQPLFPEIRILDDAGSLHDPLEGWNELQALLTQRPFVDLICSHGV